jgi:MFS family permease
MGTARRTALDRPAPQERLRDDRDFRLFLLARLVSLSGTSVTYIALPVVVYSLSRSPLLTSLVAAFEALPYLLLGLVAGALADRLDRKRVMVASDIVSGVVLASVPVAHWLGVLTVDQVLVVAFLVPSAFVFFDAADFGAIPVLVGVSRIARANSMLWSTGTVVETLVPLAAGGLLAILDGATLVSVDVLSYLASALLVRAVLRPMTGSREDAVPLGRRVLFADVKEGLRYLWGHVTVRTMTMVGACQSVAGGAYVGQAVVWADRSLGVRRGDWRLGAIFASWGLGVLVASVFVPGLARRLGAARVVLLSLPASAVLGTLAILAPDWQAATALLAAWGVAYMAIVINAVTYRQQVTPERLLSRVNTVGRMLSFGAGWPLGAILAGVVAEHTGPRQGMLAGVAVLAVGAVLAWMSPLRAVGAAPPTVEAA